MGLTMNWLLGDYGLKLFFYTDYRQRCYGRQRIQQRDWVFTQVSLNTQALIQNLVVRPHL